MRFNNPLAGVVLAVCLASSGVEAVVVRSEPSREDPAPLIAATPSVANVDASGVGESALPTAFANNDELTTATPITQLPFLDIVNTTLATANTSDPFCFGRGQSVWYTFTASTDDAIEFSTATSTYQATLFVYTLNFHPAFHTIGCAFQNSGGATVLGFTPVPGRTYAIVVSTPNGAGGGILVFSARTTGPPPLRLARGSPFLLPGGRAVEGVVVAPDNRRLIVSHPDRLDPGFSVLDVGPAGELSLLSSFPARSPGRPWGMVLNPAGDRLYATTVDRTIQAHAIDPDGVIHQVQAIGLATPSFAANGIAYASTPGGEFVYVNNEVDDNTVSAFRIVPGGHLAPLGRFPTGGRGVAIASGKSARVEPSRGDRFLVSNVASNDISVFDILADGSLGAVPGSPFKPPVGTQISGALAIEPDGSILYAGAFDKRIIKFAFSQGGALTPVQVSAPGGFGAIASLEVSPCGGLLVSVPNDLQQIQLFDTATLNQVRGSPVALATDFHADLTFARDGDFLFLVFGLFFTNEGVTAFEVSPSLVACGNETHGSLVQDRSRLAGSRVRASRIRHEVGLPGR